VLAEARRSELSGAVQLTEGRFRNVLCGAARERPLVHLTEESIS
jgi:hypothetical protein